MKNRNRRSRVLKAPKGINKIDSVNNSSVEVSELKISGPVNDVQKATNFALAKILYLVMISSAIGAGVYGVKSCMEKDNLAEFEIDGITFKFEDGFDKEFKKNPVLRKQIEGVLKDFIGQLSQELDIPQGVEVSISYENYNYYVLLQEVFDLVLEKNEITIPDQGIKQAIFAKIFHEIQTKDSSFDSIVESIESFPELSTLPFNSTVSDNVVINVVKNEIFFNAIGRFLEREGHQDFFANLISKLHELKKSNLGLQEFFEIAESLSPDFMEWYESENCFKNAEEGRIVFANFDGRKFNFLSLENKIVDGRMVLSVNEDILNIDLMLMDEKVVKMTIKNINNDVFFEIEPSEKLKSLGASFEDVSRIKISFEDGTDVPLRSMNKNAQFLSSNELLTGFGEPSFFEYQGYKFQIHISKKINEEEVDLSRLQSEIMKAIDSFSSFIGEEEKLDLQILIKEKTQMSFLGKVSVKIEYDTQGVLKNISANNFIDLSLKSIGFDVFTHELFHYLRVKAGIFSDNDSFEESLAEYVEFLNMEDDVKEKQRPDYEILYSFFEAYPELLKTSFNNVFTGNDGRISSFVMLTRRIAVENFMSKPENSEFLSTFINRQKEVQKSRASNVWTEAEIKDLGNKINPLFSDWFEEAGVFNEAKSGTYIYSILRDGKLSFFHFMIRKMPIVDGKKFSVLSTDPLITADILFKDGSRKEIRFKLVDTDHFFEIDLASSFLRVYGIDYDNVESFTLSSEGIAVPLVVL